MRAVASLLSNTPLLRKLLCQTRIALGVGTAGAYTALGNIRLKEGQHFAAAQSYWRAIQANPNGSVDPYIGILDTLANCPAIMQETRFGDAPTDPRHLGSNKQRDWDNLSFGVGQNVSQFCDFLDRTIAASPLNLGLYHRANVLIALCEFKAAMPYFYRLLEAQRRLAEVRGVDISDVRYFRNHWIFNIGHILAMECPIKASLLGWQPPRRWVVLAPPDKVANQVYLDYYRPYCEEIITDPRRIQELQPEAECLEEFGYTSELHNRHVSNRQAWFRIEQQWEAEGRPPLLRLREEDNRRGQARLRQLGVPEGAWYVGLHVRETGFHQDSDQTHRNASIAACEQAIRSITARGGWVIRMGNPMMSRLKPMPQVIDYAHSGLRCDWMDVFLCGSMRFMIGTASGLTHVPATFGVPTISTNWTCICVAPWHGFDMYIPKLFWSEVKNRYLSLEESFSTGAGFALNDCFYRKTQIRPVENDPEDINNVVVEMLDRLDGRPYSAEDDALFNQWKAIAEPHGVTCLSRVSSSFVKRHSFLMG